jgi:hypothetical protein
MARNALSSNPIAENILRRSAKVGILTLLILQAGCGLNWGGGGNSSPNDPAPQGTQVSSGQLFAGSGQTGVTGQVLIFNNNGSYILRLEGLNIPTPSSGSGNLIVNVYSNNPSSSTPVSTFSLNALTGNQNYTISNPASYRYNRVTITDSSGATVYASANF